MLDELVGIALLQQEAKAQHIGPTDQEVEQQVAMRKKQFPSEEGLPEGAQADGLDRGAAAPADARPARRPEVRRVPGAPQGSGLGSGHQGFFYEKNKDQIRSPDRMHLRHIVIAVKTTATPAEKEKARAKADDLHKQLLGGADFAKVATANSDDPGSKGRGGDLELGLARPVAGPPWRKPPRP